VWNFCRIVSVHVLPRGLLWLGKHSAHGGSDAMGSPDSQLNALLRDHVGRSLGGKRGRRAECLRSRCSVNEASKISKHMSRDMDD
jgi:hypothetical protein